MEEIIASSRPPAPGGSPASLPGPGPGSPAPSEQPSEHGSPADERVTTDQYVGLVVAKRFIDGNGREPFFGTVKWRCLHPVADDNGVEQTVWHVVYEDGDSEDMNRIELLNAIALAGACLL